MKKNVRIESGTIIKAIRIAGKIIMYAQGGFSQREIKDLVNDLLVLAAQLTEDIVDDLDESH
tara:strand:+ start:376 stop:561 length:186 start_codon:yes stop_codon:yes gene_type:complete